MQQIIRLIQREPALLVALIDALLVVGVTFGLPLHADQKGALDAFLAVVAGIIIRGQVIPVSSVIPAGVK